MGGAPAFLRGISLPFSSADSRMADGNDRMQRSAFLHDGGLRGAFSRGDAVAAYGKKRNAGAPCVFNRSLSSVDYLWGGLVDTGFLGERDSKKGPFGGVPSADSLYSLRSGGGNPCKSYIFRIFFLKIFSRNLQDIDGMDFTCFNILYFYVNQ